MISLGSFSTYDNFAKANLRVGETSTISSGEDFEKDLTVIKDFTKQVVPNLLADIFYFFNSAAQVPISSNKKSFGRCFELTDDKYPDGKKLKYEDCSIILESDEAFPDNKKDFKLNDFQYYTLRLSSDNIHMDQPRTIFIRGKLTQEGKFDENSIEQFSYTNFTEGGMEDGIVLYTNSTKTLQETYGEIIPSDLKLDDGAFILDIDRPFAKDPEDVYAKQMLLLRSGFSLRTI